MMLSECQFCGRILDADESLLPVYIGERPDPLPVKARATADKQRKVVGRRANADADIEVLGRPVDEISALLTALEASDHFSIDAKQSVAELRMVGETEVSGFVEHSTSSVQSDIDTSKVGVTVRADPPSRTETPDLSVCEHCAESLSSPINE